VTATEHPANAHGVRARIVFAMAFALGALLLTAASAFAAPPPTVDFEFTAGVTSTTATLQAAVNPNNQVTTCEFQYGETTAYGSEAPCEPASLQGGFQFVSAALSGLEAGTAYHFRVVLENASHETQEGTDIPFTTVPTPNTDPVSEIAATSATFNGHFTLDAIPTRYSFIYNAGSECGGGGSTPTAEPEPSTGASTVQLAVKATGLAPGTNYSVCLVTSNASGSDTGPAVTFTTPPAAPAVSEESVSAVSATSATLTALIDPNGADTSYRFEYATGTEYKPIPGSEGDVGSGRVATTVSVQVQEGLQPATAYHFRAVATNSLGSTDGEAGSFTTQSTASVFTLPDDRVWEMVSPPNKDGAEIENLHSKEGGDIQASENGEAITYLSSAPIEANPPGNPIESQVFSRRSTAGGWTSQDIATRTEQAAEHVKLGSIAEYKVFSPDLSLAYVEPNAPLAPPTPGSGAYIRNNNTGAFTPTTLTAQEWYAQQAAPLEAPPTCDATTSPAASYVSAQEGVLGVSENGCYVYWVNGWNRSPTISLEVSHYEGSAWKTTFIAAVSSSDQADWSRTDFGDNLLNKTTGRVSPNGQWATFMSDASLTGYDNRDAVSGNRDEEVYLYDAATNHLACTSCNPTGARPIGIFDRYEAELVDRPGSWAERWIAAILPAWSPFSIENALRQPRYLSDSGRLFFDSSDALVPQVVNGQMNVYEYEPEGVGSCAEAAGCVALISSGTSSSESAFVDASVSGNDVFFLTRSRLVSQDYDNYYDMYDAHVCAASAPCPALAPLSPQPCETGDSCKPPPSPQPALFGAPASATFSGAGNVVAAAAPTTTSKSPTPKQRLEAALEVCAKKYKAKRPKRHRCEKQARRKYGKSKTSSAKGTSSSVKRDSQGA
jgi:hypothetical protein